MKKFLKVFIVAILICPVLILVSCTPPDKFLITAKPSDINLGSIQGTYDEEKDEGTKLNLTAKEKFPDSNPFVCWVKDYSQVVSTSKTYQLSYNSSTAGHYTAVFEENQDSMRYFTLSKVNFSPAGYSNVTYYIEYSLISAGSDNYHAFANGNYNIGEEFQTDYKSVLYLGGAGENNDYKFRITLTITDNQGYVSQIQTFETTKLLNSSLFDNGICEIEQNLNSYGTFKLTFEKLKYSFYHEI